MSVLKGRITMIKSQYKKSGHDDGKMLDLKWLLEESRWCCTKSSRKEKKRLKDLLTRSYRRKQKQGKLDAEQEQE